MAELSPADTDGLVRAQYEPQGEMAGFEMLDAVASEGEGEPGTMVAVTDTDGNVVGEGVVGDDGSFKVAQPIVAMSALASSRR